MEPRVYPDEPAGPFPKPPLSFEDDAGREISLQSVGSPEKLLPGGEQGNADTSVDSDGRTGVDARRDGRSSVDERSGGRSGIDESSDGRTSAQNALTTMYVRFDPADRAQGLPPAGEERIHEWLGTILEEGVNVVAIHGATVVGHATLVPDEEAARRTAGPYFQGRDGDENATRAGIGTDGTGKQTGDASVSNRQHPEASDRDPTVVIPWELAIFVYRPYQGAGIGTRLLETTLGHAAESGVERVWLTVERWNKPAVAIYEAAGFEVCDAERFDVGMSLRLS